MMRLHKPCELLFKEMRQKSISCMRVLQKRINFNCASYYRSVKTFKLLHLELKLVYLSLTILDISTIGGKSLGDILVSVLLFVMDSTIMFTRLPIAIILPVYSFLLLAWRF